MTMAERQPEPVHQATSGLVFWITGLSGAGKTTVARELSSQLRAAGRPVILLDGDALRTAISEGLAHSPGDRQRSAMRNARLCRLLAGQGLDVVCASISLFHDVQRWNRENIPGYREIYLRVPIEELRRRDGKGIYAGANSHMAIRASELGIPAVIGAGEALFQRWQAARTLCLDCTNQKVVVIA
jgi:adenylylsulfate kinase